MGGMLAVKKGFEGERRKAMFVEICQPLSYAAPRGGGRDDRPRSVSACVPEAVCTINFILFVWKRQHQTTTKKGR